MTRIEVTAEDIANGERRNPDSCAVTLAMRRAGFKCQSVGGVFSPRGPTAWLLGHASRKIYLPVAVGVFAQQFDAGQDVEPFAFDLDVTP